jgi:hypothetical protein
MSDLAEAIRRMHMSSERAPDVRDVPMRLVRQDAFDEMLAAAEAHRSAVDANEERVESYVKHAIADEMRDYRIQFDMDGDPITCFDAERAALFTAIATRAAKQLATTVVGLSDVDRVRIRSIRDLLAAQPVCWDSETALLDRLLTTGSAPAVTATPTARLSEDERNHLLSVRALLRERNAVHAVLWGAEISTLDRLLGAP